MASSHMDELLAPIAPPESSDTGGALNKLSSLLGNSSSDSGAGVGEVDIIKTASTMEKLASALESGQAKIDSDLRELFGGEETDEDIARHNQLEDEYHQVTGQ